MSCNCHDTSPCNKCNNGQPCNCPPDYSVLPQPSPCNCCPSGFTYTSGATLNYPNGVCTNVSGTKTQPIPCVACEDAIPTDCVTYTGQIPIACNNGQQTNIYGINAGDSLTTIISKMCITNDNVIMALLSKIGATVNLSSAFCQIARNCPVPIGGTTPLPGPIIVSFP